MKIYECGICGNTHDENTDGGFDSLAADWCCPVCGAPRQSFSPAGEAKSPLPPKNKEAAVFKCRICGNTYDEASEAEAFSALPGDWACGVCGAPKQSFEGAGQQDPAPAAAAQQAKAAPVSAQTAGDSPKTV